MPKTAIGFPCRNTDILILTIRTSRQVDEPGELCVRGSSLALGYWNNRKRRLKRSSRTLTRTYQSLFYRTGDLVDRNAVVKSCSYGRRIFQIKQLGYPIELANRARGAQGRRIRNCCVVYNQAKKGNHAVFRGDHQLTPAAIRKAVFDIPVEIHVATVFHRWTTTAQSERQD